ncbi:DNA cytosine methyltransferase, partial [Paracoccaceae bacterium]|nr:DNA cytosine methyltransferase [Paracoccaceae bacterium]
AKSNKTRKVLDGILLVQSFLRCVYEKQPKYWIMENVPTIQKYLPARIPLRSIGIDDDGDFPIPTKIELIAADYGVPQKRRRYLIGNFPLPTPTHYDPSKKTMFTPVSAKAWRTMGDVLKCLPEPLEEPGSKQIIDPNYGFKLNSDKLSDHFYDARFSSIEQRSIHQAKTEHPYMGRLAWPDKTDRPARTVVATQLGRETLVLPSPNGEFRRATVRECASFQSFPISYQFYGRSYGSKYRQAGDAVPPMLSFSLAKAIAECEGNHVEVPSMLTTVDQLANKIPAEKLRKKRKPNFKRKANFLVPCKEVRGTRCELFVDGFTEEQLEMNGFVFATPIWRSDLVLGEGSNSTKRFSIDNNFYSLLHDHLLSDGRVSDSVKVIIEEWDITLNNYESAANVFCSFILEHEEYSPLRLMEAAREIAERNLPTHLHHNTHIDCSEFIDHPKSYRLKVRVLVGCLMAHHALSKWQLK